jgi:hypothetical protein
MRRRGAALPRSTEMMVVAYALARLGNRKEGRPDAPPPWLGVQKWSDAYDLFFDQLGAGRTPETFRFSLKNARDKLDPYLGSSRRGWLTPEGEVPPATGWVKRLLDEWSTRSDDDVRDAVQTFLHRSPPVPPANPDSGWSVARARIERTTRHTVSQSGTIQRRVLKNKELRCADLEATLDQLAQLQNWRCAQSGVPFNESEQDLRASLDRIDSDGHYEDGSLGDGRHNLQLVTHWYNMAKGTRSDAQMHELLRCHTAWAR